MIIGISCPDRAPEDNDIIGQLIFIADGDIELVQNALRACYRVRKKPVFRKFLFWKWFEIVDDSGAPLDEVVRHIVSACEKRTPALS